MRRVPVSLAVVILWATHAFARQSAVPPQTARQALMEMFFSKTQGTFAKHLPAATRTALEKSLGTGEPATIVGSGEPTSVAKPEYPDL